MKKICILLCLFLLLIFCIIFVNRKSFLDGDVSFTDDSITSLEMSSITPISDNLGKKITSDDNGFMSFSINSSFNKKIKYEIYLKPVTNSDSISLDYVKFYLTNKETDTSLLDEVGVVGKLDNSSLDRNYKVLYAGELDKKQALSFDFRVWVADTYSVSNIDKNLKFIIGVRPLE